MTEEGDSGTQGEERSSPGDPSGEPGGDPVKETFFRSADESVGYVSDGEWEGELPAGTVVGDFKLIRPLGRGGMGQVWEAEEMSIQRRVALKLLHSHFELSGKNRERFEREAQAGGRLSHPGIVQVLSAGSAEGRHYMAQELVEGSFTLADALNDFRQADEVPDGYYRQTAGLFVQIGKALAHAHGQGVIHRDVKPSNLLIGPDDLPKVADFGLATMEDQLSLSRTGEFMGTPFYMSPEQAATRRMGIDHRTDVFSLGATLYEALTLTRPFNGDTSQQVFQQILLIDPPDPKQLRSRVPRDLAVICLKALEKVPDQRYETMAAFVEDLERYLSERPILAKPPTTMQRGVKWARRNPTKSAVGAVAAAALVVVSILVVNLNQKSRDLQVAINDAVNKGRLAEEQAAELARTNEDLDDALVQAKASEDLAQARANDLGRTNKDLDEALVQAEASAELARREGESAAKAAYRANYLAASNAYAESRWREGRRYLSLCPMETRQWEWHRLNLLLDQSMRVLKGHGDRVYSVAWNPAGTRLVSASGDGTLRIWDAETGENLRRGVAGTLVSSVAWNPDGTRIASGSDDSTVRIWDAETGESLQILEGGKAQAFFDQGILPPEIFSGEERVNAVAWNPAGTRIASGYDDGSIYVWDVETGKRVQTMDFKGRAARALAWNADGTQIVSGWNDGTIFIWDVKTGEIINTGWKNSVGGYRDVSSVAWNAADTRILAAFGENLVVLDAETGEILQGFWGHEGRVNEVAWNAAGTRIVSGGEDSTIRIWDAETGEMQQTFWGHEGPVKTVAWNAAGANIVSGGIDSTLRVWDAEEGKRDSLVRHGLRELKAHEKSVQSIAWSSDGTRFVSASSDDTLGIWDAETGKRLLVLEGHGSTVYCVAWNPTGARIVSGSKDKSLRIWDAETGESLQVLRGHGSTVSSVAWDTSGARIVSGSYDNTLRVWDAETGESLVVSAGEFRHGDWVTAVAWNHDGTRIASAGKDQTIAIWDAETGDGLWQWTGHKDSVTSVAWNSTGTRIASSSAGGTLCIWNPGLFVPRRWDGWDVAPLPDIDERRRLLVGHEEGVTSVAWNAAGTRIVSGSLDATLRIWDVESGESMQVLKGHLAPVKAVAWNAAGTRILSGSTDGNLQFWESRPEEMIPVIRTRSASGARGGKGGKGGKSRYGRDGKDGEDGKDS